MFEKELEFLKSLLDVDIIDEIEHNSFIEKLNKTKSHPPKFLKRIYNKLIEELGEDLYTAEEREDLHYFQFLSDKITELNRAHNYYFTKHHNDHLDNERNKKK